ncbi:MAG TPA: M48 family metallopeptidase [Candidatus Obscuribacterales bacterium]
MPAIPARRYPPGSADSQAVWLDFEPGTLKIMRGQELVSSAPLSAIELKLGGYSGRRLILNLRDSSETLVCDDPGLLEALAHADTAGTLSRQVEAARQAARHVGRRELLCWVMAGGIAVLAVWLLFAGVDALVTLAIDRIPASLEQQLGDLILADYKKKHRLSTTSPEAQRVERIGKRLAAQLKMSPYDLQFSVEPSTEVNAFAVPGGNIVVLSQLLDEAKNDDEIAGVLAHEIGHVIGRHSLRSALHTAGIWVCLRAIFGEQGRDAAIMLSNFVDLDALRYSRVQETAADVTGVKLSLQANYNPEGLITFFERLRKKEGSGDIKVLEFFSSHPVTSERIDNIRKEIAKLRH